MSQKIQPRASKLNRSRVWVYFKKCDDSGNRVRCNLCSLELNIQKANNTRTILWNHIKSKHSSINDDKNIDDLILNDDININNDIYFHNNNNHEQPLSSLERRKKTSNHITSNNNSILQQNNISNNNMTPTKFNRNNINQKNASSIGSTKQTNSSISNKKSKNINNSNKNLGQNDFINDLIFDYNDLNLIDTTTTSMKPLPSSSLSRNLISRLNQFSSPVTRKLKFWNKKSFQVNQYDPSFKVIYLGNLGMQLWSKDESCLEKPLSTLWNNYLVNMKTEIVMRLTICNSGLKAITRQHGLTQYWSNRLVYCCSHKSYPRIFSWVYRHEGKKMRQELRCHAVLCPSPEKAIKMATMLNQRLACALQEFRREKKSMGGITNMVTTATINSYCNSNFNNQNNCYNFNNGMFKQQKLPRTIPLRRQILAKGTANFRPPLERSKSAPKLTSIQEEEYDSDEVEDEEDDDEEGNKHEDDHEKDNNNCEDQVSQEEFEFEESFGDRDDEESDYDEEIELGKYVDVDDNNTNDEEGDDLTHKIESNSLTTTVNEGTSNSSSVCATTSDSFYDNNNKIPILNNDKLLGGISITKPIAIDNLEIISNSKLSSAQFGLKANESINYNQQHQSIETKELNINQINPSTSNSTNLLAKNVNINQINSCQEEEEEEKPQLSSANKDKFSSLEQHVVFNDNNNKKSIINHTRLETDRQNEFKDNNSLLIDRKRNNSIKLKHNLNTNIEAVFTTSACSGNSANSKNITDINSNDKKKESSDEGLNNTTTLKSNQTVVTDENFQQEIILPYSNLVIK